MIIFGIFRKLPEILSNSPDDPRTRLTRPDRNAILRPPTGDSDNPDRLADDVSSSLRPHTSPIRIGSSRSEKPESRRNRPGHRRRFRPPPTMNYVGFCSSPIDLSIHGGGSSNHGLWRSERSREILDPNEVNAYSDPFRSESHFQVVMNIVGLV